MIVNGKYLVTVPASGSREEMLKVVEYLVGMERKKLNR